MAKMTKRQENYTVVKNDLVPASEICRWLGDVLKADDPKPSPDQCLQLAREIQIVMNRHENTELQRRGPTARDRLQMRDVDPTQELNRLVKKVESAAQRLGAATKELEDFVGAHQWTDDDRSADLEDIHFVLSTLSTVLARTSPAKRGRGRPREAWHAPGHKIAQLICSVMEATRYGGRLKKTDPESATASVGAAAISYLFDIKIGADGFATAMKDRDRSKGDHSTSFDDLYPDAAAIKVL